MTPNEQKPESQPSPAPQSQLASDSPAPASPPPAEPSTADPSPQPTPLSSPNKSAGRSMPMSRSLVLTIAIAAVVFMLVAVGAVYAYQHPKKKVTAAPSSARVHGSLASPESPTPSNCIPVKASSLTKASAEIAYQNFVGAVITQNQTCADDQSSSFFLAQAKQEFGATNGKWITASPQGIRPIWKDLAELPPSFSDSGFTQAPYTRPIILSQSSSGLREQSSGNSEQPQGLKLSYPVDLSKYTGNTSEKWQVTMSFVLQSGNLQIDDLVVEPQK